MTKAEISGKLKLFKSILNETAEAFGVSPDKVTKSNFILIQGGRLGDYTVQLLGGFSALKAWAVPGSAKRGRESSEAIKTIQRLVANAQK